MKLEIDDKHLNASMRRWLTRLLERARRAHYVNITIRLNGKDETFEADWVKHLTVKVGADEAPDLDPFAGSTWTAARPAPSPNRAPRRQ